MFTEATQQILSMVESAEMRKRSVEFSIKRLLERKRRAQFRSFRNQLLLRRASDPDRNVAAPPRTLMLLKDASEHIDLNREISDRRIKLVRVSNAIGETLHGTALSEHDNERDRRQAIDLARHSAG